MSLRKIAGLLAAFGLTVGLIGGGVGAVFQDQVTAVQNIAVGTFGCIISDGGGGTVAGDYKSVTFDAGTITSSAADSAPFHFTVLNNGTIPAKVAIAETGAPASPFGSLPVAPAGAVVLANGGTQVFSAGLKWPELSNANLNQHVSIGYTVSCVDAAGAIFDNTPAVVPSNLSSIGVEAYSFKEFGAQVQFAGTARKLGTATVTMSSWACESGSWNLNNCASTPGDTYAAPITFNIYADATAAAAHTPLITSGSQTFQIPYRPTADNVNCTGSNAGKWFDGVSCKSGIASNITFTFSGQPLPDTAIFGIAYNTDHHGYAPIGGSGSPMDSLNIAMYPSVGNGSVAVAPSVGTFLPDGLSAYLNDSYGPFYMDGGTGGLNTFRLDTGTTTSTSIGAYGGFMPSVRITATN